MLYDSQWKWRCFLGCHSGCFFLQCTYDHNNNKLHLHLDIYEKNKYLFDKPWNKVRNTICNYDNFLIIYIKNFSSTKEILMQRESRTTMALFFICLSYLIFVGPVTISDVIHDLKLYDDESTLHSDLHLVIINIYWLQFSCNFFIYAARSEQFRMAYLYFLKNVSWHFLGENIVLWFPFLWSI